MQKPFFVHINNKRPGNYRGNTPRGATILVSPKDDHQVEVRVAYCSKQDQFEKAIGRAVAAASESQVINKRMVPKFVSDVEAVTAGEPCSLPREYDYLLRNFV